MSVSVSVTLPAQPATGTVRYQALGGDGVNTPIGMYSVVGLQVTGDATGGSATLQVIFDAKYQSLLAYANFGAVQVASADADYRVTLSGSGLSMPTASDSGLIVATSATLNVVTLGKLWQPPPFVTASLPGQIGTLAWQVLNVDLDSYTMSAAIYVFDILAREHANSMGQMLFNARGGS